MATETVATKAPAKQEVFTVNVNEETNKLVSLAFGAQSDIENESKFIRSFMYDAVKARLQYMAKANIAAWEREVDKKQRLHPTWTREQALADLLASRKAKELFELSIKSAEVLKVL